MMVELRHHRVSRSIPRLTAFIPLFLLTRTNTTLKQNRRRVSIAEAGQQLIKPRLELPDSVQRCPLDQCRNNRRQCWRP
ncbi:MAG: hypothetical protein VW349_06665, partial [Gammaproteobacteria bacterium]